VFQSRSSNEVTVQRKSDTVAFCNLAGLIPADPETWKVRRRQIVPAFHKVREQRDRRLSFSL
jgi:hypothetical protein